MKIMVNVDIALGAGMFAWHKEAIHIAGLSGSDVGSRQLEDASFWRTLAADVTPLGAAAPASFGEEYHEVRAYTDLLDECEYDAMKVSTMPKAKDLETYTNDSLFVDAWFQAAFQRHFCSTKEVRIGLVSDATMKNDLVAFLLGADVLFVHRTTDVGMFVLVVKCYVRGIMTGEALKGKDTTIKDILLQ